MMKRNGAVALLSALGLLGLTATAHAGAYTDDSVEVYVNVNGYIDLALGSLSAAASSDDDDQYIGCSVVAHPSGNRTGTCWARDRERDSTYCVTTAPALLTQILAMSDSSHVLFTTDRDGNCAQINVHQSSRFTTPHPVSSTGSPTMISY